MELEFVLAFPFVGMVVSGGGDAFNGDEGGSTVAEVDEDVILEAKQAIGVEVPL